MFSLTQTSTRQREIVEIVLGNGWDYMRSVLTGGKSDRPQLPPPEVLRKILVELGPFYVKFGQLLSTRPDLLPPQYIEALTALQAQVPPVPWGLIEKTLMEQLNQPLDKIFADINHNPIAAGSIAQIHKATLATGEEVAIKVQRPDIERIVNQDINLIKSIAEIVALTDFGNDYDVVTLADEFTKAVQAELDFRQEAQFTDKLRLNLSNSNWFDSKQLEIPQIYWEFTTEKVLLMEWLDGKPILDADIAPDSKKRQEISTLLFRAFFQQIFIDGFFHADPHPGNIFYLSDGRLGIIDCGMIGRLDPRTQQLLTEMLLAIVDIDAQRCAQLTLELSESNSYKTNLAQLENDYSRMLRKYYNLSLSQLNFSEVFYEVLDVSRRNKIKLPGNMGLYAKSLANLEGVARKFNPEINLLAEIKPLITDLFRRQLIGDTPFQTLFRTVLDLKAISLRSPRQIDVILDRLSSETFQWKLQLRELEGLRRSLDDSANRLSFSIVVGSLTMGAAIISTGATTAQLIFISNILFAAATFLGIWLIVSILRSGKLK
ncbi:AarF/ABC1/UbiB kinase family protein [Cyanobacterium aponinum UTEX 3222]|uniref:AarF/ABC1/UbiB kinase family protein n=2 Tax=Cyanobacterium aponinum TaxID=379064 RepID=A0A844GVD7_9CHRO|nr:AarF/ABC1/UbiB kinase family protein [Cyanobacterium aponinum]WRL41453.1 AarF/ABC1/UbiB kinase family protein [Cyanobacterium aponinum UTEX 3222]MBD2393431.1 AarF/ABC1/UbiB kinase family protein [Cyanobacterium aponinum FACHB-4101]MTF39011.1 AarF/ABC1/UbiB kinase family protein [Cyanobacterium aponinum 0216]PHV62418.1 ABC transporter [Cyanobacterium aponinum IPPAS B-1201]WPF89677.1 AarF/ABC1/UbiB kinase family protein [Cyanobacterium aponinum AL20115]